MARIALIAQGITSTLYNGLELSRRLAERGHHVTVLCHADVAETVEANGHDFVRLTAHEDAVVELRAPLAALRDRRYGRAIAGLAALPGTLWRVRRDTAAAIELLDAVRGLEPDLLVIDTEAHVAILATSSLNVPTVLTTACLCVTERPHVPPMNSRLGPEDPRAIAAAWDETRVTARRARRRRSWSRRGLTDRVGPISYSTTSPIALRAVARGSGFDVAGRTDPRQWLRPHVYVDLPTLSTNLWELEFDHEPPSNWQYVGPMVHLDRCETRVEIDDRERWERFRSRAGADERPLVYCSLGSYWSTDEQLLSRVVEAFRRHQGWDLVIGLGGRADPDVLEPIPQNVLVLRWAPQVEVLAAADAAIVHGGNAGLNECVVHGVPMVVYSTGHLDQPGVAARIAHHGLGVVGDTTGDTAETIARHVETVLGDPAIAPRLRGVRALALDPSRVDVAAEVLEQLIAGETPLGQDRNPVDGSW